MDIGKLRMTLVEAADEGTRLADALTRVRAEIETANVQAARALTGSQHREARESARRWREAEAEVTKSIILLRDSGRHLYNYIAALGGP